MPCNYEVLSTVFLCKRKKCTYVYLCQKVGIRESRKIEWDKKAGNGIERFVSKNERVECWNEKYESRI